MKFRARTKACTLVAAFAIGIITIPGYAFPGSTEPISMAAASKKKKPTIEVLDVMQIDVSAPSRAIKHFDPPHEVKRVECDVLVVGGGTGGAAAALAASSRGIKVCLTEETDWLGGQMTAQGVSALDENYLVETSGANRSYQKLRTAIRNNYLSRFTPTPKEAADPYLNPGNCWVSRLSFEPSVGLKELAAELQPAIDSGQLSIYHRCKPVEIKKSGGKITAVITVNLESGQYTEFIPRICLDATELGDVLPLAGLSYRSGSEAGTGEPHAPEKADPENVQDFVFPFAIEFRTGEQHSISKPDNYDAFNGRGKFSFLGYKMFQTVDLIELSGLQMELLPFWTYRRLLDRSSWITAPYEHDLSMINWDSNDLRGENIIDQPSSVQAERLAQAKRLSLGFLYWLQTEAARDEGGQGYPELLLRPDVMGTADGLSKYPYIRESRRINALEIVREQDIAVTNEPSARARQFDDSVGIGLYPIDIHGYQEVPGAAQPSRPFQVPLGCLIPQDCRNLLAAAKNIGTTHITNGAFRLHPIEWAIGEATGHLAAYCIAEGTLPEKVRKDKKRLRGLQWQIVNRGIPVYWYDDVPTNSPYFPGIQFLAITGLMLGGEQSLSFKPQAEITRAEAAGVLASFVTVHPIDRDKPAPPDVMANDPLSEAISACSLSELIPCKLDGNFAPQDALKWADIASSAAIRLLREAPPAAPSDHPVTRADFAAWVANIATQKKFLGKF